MSALRQNQIEEAERMRVSGQSWRAIGRAFHVKEETIMAAVDPIYAERRRERLRQWRAKNGHGEKVREHVDPRLLKVRKPVDQPQPVGMIWPLTSEVGRELEIWAITVKSVMPAMARGLQTGFANVPISLPYIPTIHGKAA